MRFAQSCNLPNSVATLPVTIEVADLAAGLRRTQRWKLPDAIQAAIAIWQAVWPSISVHNAQ